jgi:hypothetical protein
MSPKQKPVTGMSTPKTDTLDELGQEGEGRSILDFGRAKPGEETQTPTIVLNIPIQAGETNKYVNFMRLAEDRFGWDALHPRLAANRDRKARIAAAAASLEKVEFGHESGDDMSVDLSEPEASNAENGATSGMDAQVKPKKKRNFKEDNYDVDDEFVDDSELMWEAQAAASRDGFFVYSGPLVPEVEKPAGYVYTIVLALLNVFANMIIVMRVPLSAVVALVVVAVAVEVPRHVEEPAPAAVVAPVRVVAPSPGSLASLSLRRRSVSGRRRNARRWRSSPRRPLLGTQSSPRHRRFRSPNWVPSSPGREPRHSTLQRISCFPFVSLMTFTPVHLGSWRRHPLAFCLIGLRVIKGVLHEETLCFRHGCISGRNRRIQGIICFHSLSV